MGGGGRGEGALEPECGKDEVNGMGFVSTADVHCRCVGAVPDAYEDKIELDAYGRKVWLTLPEDGVLCVKLGALFGWGVRTHGRGG